MCSGRRGHGEGLRHWHNSPSVALKPAKLESLQSRPESCNTKSCAGLARQSPAHGDTPGTGQPRRLSHCSSFGDVPTGLGGSPQAPGRLGGSREAGGTPEAGGNPTNFTYHGAPGLLEDFELQLADPPARALDLLLHHAGRVSAVRLVEALSGDKRRRSRHSHPHLAISLRKTGSGGFARTRG